MALFSYEIKELWLKNQIIFYDEIFIPMIPRSYGCSCFVFSDFCHSSRAALDERLWIFPPPCFRLMYTWSNVALLHWCVQFKEEAAMLWDLVVVSKLSLIEFNSLGQFHTVTHRAFCSQGNSQATLHWRGRVQISIYNSFHIVLVLKRIRQNERSFAFYSVKFTNFEYKLVKLKGVAIFIFFTFSNKCARKLIFRNRKKKWITFSIGKPCWKFNYWICTS